MAIMTALTYAFYTMGTLAAADAMLTEPPESKLTSQGQAAGGPTSSQAQNIFQTGQPTPQAGTVPEAPKIESDPGAQASIGSILASTAPTQAPPPTALPPPGQAPPGVVPPTQPGPLGVIGPPQQIAALTAPTPPPIPGPPGAPTAPAAPGGIGGFLSGLQNSAQALASVSDLLGLKNPEKKTLAIGGAHGGQGGAQSPFQLPQRNTLAQILGSLPRAYG